MECQVRNRAIPVKTCLKVAEGQSLSASDLGPRFGRVVHGERVLCGIRREAG